MALNAKQTTFNFGTITSIWLFHVNVSSTIIPKNFILVILDLILLSQLTLVAICEFLLIYEDGTDRVFRNVSIQNSNARELPKRKNTTGNNSMNMSKMRRVATCQTKNVLNMIWEGLMNFDNIFDVWENDYVKRKRE